MGTRVTLPGPDQRLRCASCGNLTRFDVTRTVRSTEYWHFTLAGDHQVEDTDVLAEDVGEIRCRWCGSTDVRVVPTPQGFGVTAGAREAGG